MRLTSLELESQLKKVRELESRLTFRLTVLSKILDQQSLELLKGSGINLTSYRVMHVVDTFEAISISDISRFAALDRAQISRTAAELERRGLVAYGDDPQSKRKKLVRLTPAGLALLDEIRPKFVERNRRLEEQLGPEAYEGLWKGLTKLGQIVSG